MKRLLAMTLVLALALGLGAVPALAADLKLTVRGYESGDTLTEERSTLDMNDPESAAAPEPTAVPEAVDGAALAGSISDDGTVYTNDAFGMACSIVPG